jgi:hypothetical protein
MYAGNQKLLNSFSDKSSAVDEAKQLALDEKTSFFVFDESGELVEK